MKQSPWRWLLAAALLGLAASCNTVEFYQKGRLGTPVMDLSQDPTLTHFEQKVFYSIEGAAGGIGASAGGGCGCY
ncbi:MAG TPA: DUF4266 domain-containing protein [Planctomycetota bacterium]|nr:DUF4266 domain-containing protein [Planctomycetota bacterium]